MPSRVGRSSGAAPTGGSGTSSSSGGSGANTRSYNTNTGAAPVSRKLRTGKLPPTGEQPPPAAEAAATPAAQTPLGSSDKVLTCWETWFDPVDYYAEHYGKIMELLEDILFNDSNFKIVSKRITLLESSKLQLSEALNIVDKVAQTVIQNKNSLISEKVKCHDKTS
ncbi:hypothetical protein ANN_18460 [Periplaneta americana]|uniref:Uncharacterized protein n=1 Tax=Periplaneta americana TaxID=6978 RepID=A0ABQ8SQ14_PERAM|nr:hypothetical protein ANN_18460 [Periplaneta americana]